jgi:hypothetical protein
MQAAKTWDKLSVSRHNYYSSIDRPHSPANPLESRAISSGPQRGPRRESEGSQAGQRVAWASILEVGP